MRLPCSIVSCVAVALLLHVTVAEADKATIEAYVERTLVGDDSVAGGCLAMLSASLSDVLPACQTRWVNFSCDGTYVDPVRGYRMLDQAQLALATGMKVMVVVDDSRRPRGNCLATRIDVMVE